MATRPLAEPDEPRARDQPTPAEPAPTPPPSDSIYSEGDCDLLLQKLEASADDWQATLEAQGGALVLLARAWPYMIRRQEEAAWHLCKNRLTRLRFIEGEAEQHRTFRRIMALGTNEPDIRAASLVNPHAYAGYQLDTDEHVYEKVGGWLHFYMECVKHNQIPLAFHFWMGILALSAACRRNVYVELGGDRLWMDQYIFLVGTKGSGKSVAMRYAREVLARMNDQLFDYDSRGDRVDRYEWQVNFLPEDSGQEHIVNELETIGSRKVRDEDLNETQEPVDATGLLLIDEMSVHYGQDNWAVGKKTPFYVSIAGRDYFDKGTVKRGRQTIRNMLFSMAGCSAPEWMRDVVSPHVLKGGFVDRTLYIYRTHSHRCYSQFDRPVVDPLMMDDLAAHLISWTKPPLGMRRPVEFTPAAKDWMRDRYRRDRMQELRALDEGRLTDERASLVRSSNQLLKLTTLLCMSEGMFPRADLGHIELAMEILQAEDVYYKAFLGEVRRTKHSDVLDYIKEFFRQNGWEVKRTDLTQHFRRRHGIVKAKDLEPYISTLLETGDIMKDMRTTGGKDALWYVWIGEK